MQSLRAIHRQVAVNDAHRTREQCTCVELPQMQIPISSPSILVTGTRIATLLTSKTLRRIARLIVLIVLGVPAGPGIAAQEEAAAQAPVREAAPVQVANRTIIFLRGPVFGYSAKDRATRTMARIEQVLAVEALPVVSIEDNEDGTRVLVGGQHAFMVTKIDIDPQAGETTKNVAREAARRLQDAIAERHEQGSLRFLAMAAFFSTLATLLYGTVLWLIIRANRWAGKHLSVAAAAGSQKIRIGGVNLLYASHVILLSRRIFVIITWVVAALLGSAWLTYVLSQFPYTRPWGEHMEGNLLEVVKQAAIAMVGALPGLLFAVVIFAVAWQIIRLTSVFFDRVENGRLDVGWIDSDTVKPTRRIFNLVIWVFALAMAYPYLPGAHTDAFKGLSLLVGVMISLGSSSMLGQAFSGLILMYNRAFRRGDYVRIGDSEGTVVELGMFMTRIHTGLGEEITLPNSGVMATTIKNYSHVVPGTGTIVDTVVSIGYSVPWRQVQAMLEEAAKRTQSISVEPEPLVRQTALSDFYIEYRLIAYTPAETPVKRVEVLSELHGHIQDVFNEHGVQIMSPHYMMEAKERQVVPKDQWYAAPARPPEEHERGA